MRAVGAAVVALALVSAAGCGASRASSGIPPGSASSASSAQGSAPSTSVSAAGELPPPYIAKVVWVRLPSGRSLQVYPTPNGRRATAATAEGAAWAEVVKRAPDAETPGMRAQFECHWELARLADPGKASWNLEPWRPVVSGAVLYDTRCNPGGPEV